MDYKNRMYKFSWMSILIIFSSFFFFIGTSKADDTGRLIQNLKSKDPTVRKEAVRILGESKDLLRIKRLIAALKESDREVRCVAEDALVSIGEPAVEPLTALLKDKSWRVRRRAVRTLWKIKSPSAIDPLTVAMKTDEDVYVRMFSARGLGEINDTRSAEILLDGLKNKNLELVKGAYCFFIRRGESGSEPILIEALNNSWNRVMAIDFLNCGNKRLGIAASDWAKKRAESGSTYYVMTLSSDWTGPKWGKEE